MNKNAFYKELVSRKAETIIFQELLDALCECERHYLYLKSYKIDSTDYDMEKEVYDKVLEEIPNYGDAIKRLFEDLRDY